MSSTAPGIRRATSSARMGAGRAMRAIGKRAQARSGVPSRIALLGALVAMAAGGSAAAFQALPTGGQVNDDLAAGIDKTISVSGEDPSQCRRGRRRADRRQAGGPVGGLPPAGDERVAAASRPGIRSLVRGRRLDDAWQRHGRRPLERQPAVQRLAQLRPGTGWRGSGDRLRGGRTHGPVGDLVREHASDRLRRPTTSSPAASTTPATRTRASGSSAARAGAPAEAACRCRR